MQKETKGSLNIQIVTYEEIEHLQKCLDSLKWVDELTDSRISVWDNSVTDRVSTFISEKYPQIQFHKSGENLGFGKGHNRLFFEHGGKDFAHTLILNPDTTLSEETLKEMSNSLGGDHAIVAPQVIAGDGEVEPTIFKQISGKWYPLLTILSLLRIVDSRFDLTRSSVMKDVPGISGVCMLIRSDIFNEIGGFNEKYFMYYEDRDLCSTVISRGYSIVYNPGAALFHVRGASGEKQESASEWFKEQTLVSQAIYFSRHGDLLDYLLVKYFNILRAHLIHKEEQFKDRTLTRLKQIKRS